MKRIVLSLLALLLLFTGSACKKETKESESEAFSPLFRFTVAEGQSHKTRLFYLSQSRGYLYLHPSEDGGFTGGFVSPDRSLSCEAMLKSDAPLSSVLVWENGKDRAHILTEKEFFLILPAENAAKSTPLPHGVGIENALSCDPLSFIEEKDGLLLLHPVDFSQTYVLAEKARLPDFAALMTASHEGKRIWYAKGEEGAFSGIAFFEYGNNLPLGGEAFPFDSFSILGEGKVLFARETDGDTLYTYRDLESGLVRNYLATEEHEGAACSADGSVLCLSQRKGEGSRVLVIDLEKGGKKGELSFSYGHVAPSMALNTDGKELLLALGSGSDEMLGTINTDTLS